MIRSVDYGDDHRILSFLTRQGGRVDAIALGAKKSLKRFGPALDFLNRLQLQFEGPFASPPKSGLRRLMGVELQNTYPLIRREYERTWIALEWCRILSQALREEGPAPGLFEEMELHLCALGQGTPQWVDDAFQFRLLRSLGYSLELTRCARCHGVSPGTVAFVPGEGGLLCGSCYAPKTSDLRLAFLPAQWWEISSDQGRGDLYGNKGCGRVLAEALAFFLGIGQKERKTTRNHSQGFRVVGRKVGGLKTKEQIRSR